MLKIDMLDFSGIDLGFINLFPPLINPFLISSSPVRHDQANLGPVSAWCPASQWRQLVRYSENKGQDSERQNTSWKVWRKIGRGRRGSSATASWEGTLGAIPQQYQPHHWRDRGPSGSRTYQIRRLGKERKSDRLLTIVIKNYTTGLLLIIYASNSVLETQVIEPVCTV